MGATLSNPPRAIDDINEDTVFSPNGDGVQDTLLIGFVTDGDLGDFRIMIDTHGPSGVGSPDGRFDVEEGLGNNRGTRYRN